MRSIAFGSPMIGALYAGHKWQSRRVVRPSPRLCWSPTWRTFGDGVWFNVAPSGITPVRCPYGAPGDRLLVLERLARADDGSTMYIARRSPCPRAGMWRWRGRELAAMYMPREVSRFWLRLRAVGVARLSAMTDEDALAEGAIEHIDGGWTMDPGGAELGRSVTPLAAYHALWRAIHGPRWELELGQDPWLFVLTFDVKTPGADGS